jgi:Spy/CpxP family protein refolding chaperone
MKHRTFIAAIAAAIFMTGIAVSVMAQPQGMAVFQGRRGPGGPFNGAPGRPFGGPGGFGLPGLRALDLNDAQKEQIKTITQSHREEMRQIAERMRTQILSVLTPEQQQKFNELRAERRRPQRQ